MPRTAPVVNGTPITIQASFRFIDAQGDLRSVAVRGLPAEMTSLNIEAMAVALAAATNADLYAVEVSQSYAAVPDASNALDAVINSARANIVISAKNPQGDLRNTYIPAPLDSLFIPDTDTPLVGALYTPVFSAYLAMLGASFDVVSVRFTERREINERVRV